MALTARGLAFHPATVFPLSKLLDFCIVFKEDVFRQETGEDDLLRRFLPFRGADTDVYTLSGLVSEDDVSSFLIVFR